LGAALSAAEIEEIAWCIRRLRKIFEGFDIAPDLLERVSDWVISSRGSRAGRTRRAMFADLGVVSDLCRINKQVFLPMPPRVLAAYIDRVGQFRLPATMARHVWALSGLHKAAGLEDPAKSEVVRDAQRRHRRSKGLRQKQAEPMRSNQVMDVLAVLDVQAGSGRLQPLRDRAFLLLAHDTGCRSDDLARLYFEDVRAAVGGRGVILLRSSKTDPDGRGVDMLLSGRTLCAIEAWAKASGLNEGPILRGLAPDGSVRVPKPGEMVKGLSYAAMYRIVKAWGAFLGLDLGCHSTRVGFFQDLLAKGVSTLAAGQAGRAKPMTVVRYSQRLAVEESAAAVRFLGDG
jgi:integrase